MDGSREAAERLRSMAEAVRYQVAFGARTVKMEEDRIEERSLRLDIGTDPRAHVQNVHRRGNMTFAPIETAAQLDVRLTESTQHEERN